MDRKPLEAYEQGCSLISLSFAEDPNVYYAVGCAIALPDEPEPTKVLLTSLLSPKPYHTGLIERARTPPEKLLLRQRRCSMW